MRRTIIPRSALRGNKIYRVNAQSRLEIGTVERLYNQDGFSIIKSGIEDGDNIVVTDLLPAVAGMLLATEVDNQLKKLPAKQKFELLGVIAPTGITEARKAEFTALFKVFLDNMMKINRLRKY